MGSSRTRRAQNPRRQDRRTSETYRRDAKAERRNAERWHQACAWRKSITKSYSPTSARRAALEEAGAEASEGLVDMIALKDVYYCMWERKLRTGVTELLNLVYWLRK